MSSIIVPVEMEDRIAVAKGIQEINSLQHIRYMSRAMLVNCSGIKDTKLRATLQAMINDNQVKQYQLTNNKKLQRYYYTLTDEGLELLDMTPPVVHTACGNWCDAYDADTGSCTMPSVDKSYGCPLETPEVRQ